MNWEWSTLPGYLLSGLGHITIWLMCIAAMLMSAVSLSGTWVVAIAALLAAWWFPSPFPGWLTLISFLVVSALVEVVEAFSGNIGILRRGGSTAAGWAALGGAIVGMIAGAPLIPIPVIGSLIGMIIGSFAAAYLVEHNRLKNTKKAAHIARGAVWARLSMILLKLVATIGMTIVLFAGLYAGRL